jgi:predicted transcriptional regulator
MRRTPAQIKIDVLSALRHTSLKLTHIMYTSNVNCNVLKSILNRFVEMQLVEITPPTTPLERRLHHGIVRKTSRQPLYKLTPKGIQVLHSWTELENVLFQIGEAPKPFCIKADE